MLNQLLASQPERRRAPGGFAASVALHGLIIAAVVAATAEAHIRRRPPDVEYLSAVYSPPRPPVAPAKAPATPLARTVAVPNIISVPIDVPNVIPPVDLSRPPLDPTVGTLFIPGGSATVGHSGIEPLPPAAVYAPEQVEYTVVLDPRSPLPRYPQVLKDAGVEGSARVRFVVDTLGRVEPESVQAVDATHPLFAIAVQASLSRLRFSPARVGERKVRQLVEFPIEFRIAR